MVHPSTFYHNRFFLLRQLKMDTCPPSAQKSLKKQGFSSKSPLTFENESDKINWSANADNSLLPARPGAIQTIRRCNQHG